MALAGQVSEHGVCATAADANSISATVLGHLRSDVRGVVISASVSVFAQIVNNPGLESDVQHLACRKEDRLARRSGQLALRIVVPGLWLDME